MQLSGPSTPGVDLLTWMQQATDYFQATTGVALLPLARNLGFCFAVVRILKSLLDAVTEALLGRPEMAAMEGISCFARIAFINFVISYWINVIPPFGVSFPDIFTAAGREIASTISMLSLDQLLDEMDRCWQGLEHPPMWNFFGLVIYYFVLLGMSLLDGALFFVTFLGTFAMSLGRVFGCLLATFYLLPGYESKFHNLIGFLWNYSMYRATAAAFVMVVSTFLVRLFQTVVHSDYTLGHMSAIAVVLAASILATVAGAFKVPHFNAELFGGGVAGGEMGNSVRNLALVIARRGM